MRTRFNQIQISKLGRLAITKQQQPQMITEAIKASLSEVKFGGWLS